MTNPNIILIVLDTARAETVYPAIDDNRLDTISEISANGVTFRNCISVAPWTVPSHASIFTGQYTSDHGTHAGNEEFDPDSAPIAGRLSSQGYRTAGISANTWISPEFGFDKGFDQFKMKWDPYWDAPDMSNLRNVDSAYGQFRRLIKEVELRDLPKAVTSGIYAKWVIPFLSEQSDDGAQRITDQAINFIKSSSSEGTPFFLFLNYLEPHLEYDPPQEYKDLVLPDGDRGGHINQDPWAYLSGKVEMEEEDFDQLQKLYLAEILYLDSQIRRIQRFLETKSLMEDTLLILVGDHGEHIGEHNLMDHQYSLYDNVIRVPLIIDYPEAWEMNRNVTDIVETRDLFPTILEASSSSQETQEEISTKSLLPNEKGEIETRPYAISEYVTPQPSIDKLYEKYPDANNNLTKYDRALRSLRTSRWKLIEATDGTASLYSITDDPDEENDVKTHNKKRWQKLSEKLDTLCGSFEKIEREGDEVSDDTRDRLESLGYL